MESKRPAQRAQKLAVDLILCLLKTMLLRDLEFYGQACGWGREAGWDEMSID